jgi:tetrahydromethanopterin S-methyltransferase subunit A
LFTTKILKSQLGKRSNILTKNTPLSKSISNNISNSGSDNVFVQGGEIKGNITIGNPIKD